MRIVWKVHHVRCEMPHRCVRRTCRCRCSSASSLTDSLRSVVRLWRAVSAHSKAVILLSTQSGDNAGKNMWAKNEDPRKGRAGGAFSIGSAPLTSITKIDAQVRGGETRQDLKIPGVSPWWLPRALSCSCLSVYRCHSAVMAAFISFHAWHSVPGRQFAPSWTVCTTPPFSPTAAPCPVTIILSPTRKDTTYRHWLRPLVRGVQEITDAEFLKLEPNYG